MNYYEADIIRTKQRIKKIRENPDPARLKSNTTNYEHRLNSRRKDLEHWRQGKPFADYHGMGECLLDSMGFRHSRIGGLSHSMMEPQKYLEEARAMGLPVENACDSAYIGTGMIKCGDLPEEAIGICTPHGCTPKMLQRTFISHHLYEGKVFSYCFDLPFEQNEASIEYLVNQYREFIDLVEKKFPGIKYDEDKLIECQAEEKAESYNFEVFQMLKHKPSPIAGYDCWQGWGGAGYSRAQRDEIAERIEKGIAAVPGEKLRILWAVTRPLFFDPFKVLTKRKAAVIFRYTGNATDLAPVPQPVYYGGRKLTPLEIEAADVLTRQYGVNGAKWVSDMMWVCKELEIDAIIYYNQRGCTPTLGLRRMVEETAEKELGIPTLQLEGKKWDSSYADEATITAQLDEFAQMCLSRKGLA
ncbi:2-hydroxyacyl-CoA dehydratase [Chloroflexota bacterium]